MLKQLRKKAWNWLRQRKDYRKVFLDTPEGRRVLKDIHDYCQPNKTIAVPGDVFLSGVREGARMTANRIYTVLNLSDAEIRALELKENFYAPSQQSSAGQESAGQEGFDDEDDV